MKTELEIILEAVRLIQQFSGDKEVINEQCNIIIRNAKEIKRRLK
jgi:hypothetical protein